MKDPKETEEKKNKQGLKSYVQFSGVALQMGATIFAGAYGGKYLDAKYNVEDKWFTIGLTLGAVALSLFNVLRQVNRLNEESEN